MKIQNAIRSNFASHAKLLFSTLIKLNKAVHIKGKQTTTTTTTTTTNPKKKRNESKTKQ